MLRCGTQRAITERNSDTAMPDRINRAIELFEQDQPAYYTGGHTGAVLTHQQGVQDAHTWADYINVGMEHGAFDMTGLGCYMQGLVKGGPTNSGHRTPTVIVEAPVDGTSDGIIRYSAWQFRQILARGVHGILLCQAETPDAVRAFVESCRYPRNMIGVGKGLERGTRGVGSEPDAAPIWGIDGAEYIAKCDPWPLNPEGELMLGIKVESVRGVAHIEQMLAVPGLAFAECGPGDLHMSYGVERVPGQPFDPRVEEASERVRKACAENGVMFLGGGTHDTIAQAIDNGVRVVSGGSEETAKAGRAHTKRSMPVG